MGILDLLGKPKPKQQNIVHRVQSPNFRFAPNPNRAPGAPSFQFVNGQTPIATPSAVTPQWNTYTPPGQPNGQPWLEDDATGYRLPQRTMRPAGQPLDAQINRTPVLPGPRGVRVQTAPQYIDPLLQQRLQNRRLVI